jgi:hypothetical protein
VNSSRVASFANAIVVLYVVAALLGAILYLYFKVQIGPKLELDRHWQAIGFFDLKEDFVAIGLGLLPAYWVCWRRPQVDEPGRTRAALTAVLGLIVWWGFLVVGSHSAKVAEEGTRPASGRCPDRQRLVKKGEPIHLNQIADKRVR